MSGAKGLLLSAKEEMGLNLSKMAAATESKAVSMFLLAFLSSTMC